MLIFQVFFPCDIIFFSFFCQVPSFAISFLTHRPSPLLCAFPFFSFYFTYNTSTSFFLLSSFSPSSPYSHNISSPSFLSAPFAFAFSSLLQMPSLLFLAAILTSPPFSYICFSCHPIRLPSPLLFYRLLPPVLHSFALTVGPRRTAELPLMLGIQSPALWKPRVWNPLQLSLQSRHLQLHRQAKWKVSSSFAKVLVKLIPAYFEWFPLNMIWGISVVFFFPGVFFAGCQTRKRDKGGKVRKKTLLNNGNKDRTFISLFFCLVGCDL